MLRNRTTRCKIITFSSYSGGIGRTMTVANIAWLLAVAGRRVLAVDWNLRAPRLLEFLHPFWPETDPRNEPGVIDALWQHILEVYRSPSVYPSSNGPAPLLETTTKLSWHFPGDGAVNIVNAGYPKSIRLRTELFPYEDLFQRLSGQHFIDRIRASAAEQYHYVLIDSPLVLDDRRHLLRGVTRCRCNLFYIRQRPAGSCGSLSRRSRNGKGCGRSFD